MLSIWTNLKFRHLVKVREKVTVALKENEENTSLNPFPNNQF